MSAVTAKVLLETLATLLQVSRKTFWSLQQCCKCLEKLFGVCRNAASVPKNFLEFAGTLQVPRKTFRRLQKRCKCLEKLFGVCSNAANAPKNFLEFAGTLQVSRKTFRRLQECCKHFQKCFSPLRVIRRTSLLILCLPRTHVISVKACRAGTFLLLLRGQKTDGLTDKHKKENGKDFSGIRHGKRRLRSAYL